MPTFIFIIVAYSSLVKKYLSVFKVAASEGHPQTGARPELHIHEFQILNAEKSVEFHSSHFKDLGNFLHEKVDKYVIFRHTDEFFRGLN